VDRLKGINPTLLIDVVLIVDAEGELAGEKLKKLIYSFIFFHGSPIKDTLLESYRYVLSIAI